MNTLDAIFGRRSIRHFTERPVDEEIIRTLLRAAMAAPTAVNARDWGFAVVRDRALLDAMADINGPAANPLRRAPLGILVCGDRNRSFAAAPDYWIIDGAAACENLLLAAHEMGLGGCWLGTWPRMERLPQHQALLNLPEGWVPHSILALGWPDETVNRPRPDYEESQVLWL